jgi:hypothetical protein
LVERQQALFAALAHDADHPAAHVQVFEIDRDQLAQAQPGGVEQLEDGTIAAAERSGGVRRLDQARHLRFAEKHGNRLIAFGRDGHCRWIVFDYLFAAQIPDKGLERR